MFTFVTSSGTKINVGKAMENVMSVLERDLRREMGVRHSEHL